MHCKRGNYNKPSQKQICSLSATSITLLHNIRDWWDANFKVSHGFISIIKRTMLESRKISHVDYKCEMRLVLESWEHKEKQNKSLKLPWITIHCKVEITVKLHKADCTLKCNINLILFHNICGKTYVFRLALDLYQSSKKNWASPQ